VPELTGPIAWQGAFITLRVMQSHDRVAALKRAGRAYTAPQDIRALLDTGASCTCLDREVVAILELETRGVIDIHTPSTGPSYERRNQFDATLVLGIGTNRPLEATVPVIESEFRSRGFDALIGRDLLNLCVLTYDGPAGQFTLRW